jgi:ABC-type amino acid transport substrate-binding protein
MQRTDVLRAISRHCRQSHTSALFVIGWLAAGSTAEELERLLDAIHEAERALGPDGHLAAYAERWGMPPTGVQQ